MIELAPNHKIGLSLSNPVMIAAGCCGYGHAHRHLIDLSAFGALVTNPITLRPRRGTPQPRLAETTAGFILNTGAQNPGVKKVIQEHGKNWLGSKVPVIAHLPADEPDNLLRTARALAGTEAIVAIELGLPHEATPRRRDVEHWIRAIREGCMLPLLVKLPLGRAIAMAEVVANASADVLVIGAPPLGAALSPANGEMISGYLYGPALYSMALREVQIARELVDLPIIAVGGIHSLADAQVFIAAGATTVQIDTLLWLEPALAYDIAAALHPEDVFRSNGME
jgi:dihydroorotate dehydrogenase (NAD+) catalytic subunit